MKNEKLKIKKFLSTIILVFFFLSLAGQTFAICEGPIVPCGTEWADNPNPPPDKICTNPCQFCDIFVLINNVINLILKCLVPIIAVLMLVIGGFYFLIAGPSPEKVRDAKAIITAAVIGLVIVFVAWIFVNSFLIDIGLVKGTWWQIQCP